MRDVVVCSSCLIEEATRGGSWCDECYSTCIRSTRKTERVQRILDVPVTAEAPNGIFPL